MRQSFKYVCLGILIALPLLFMGENQFSYANQESNFEQEIQNAIEAQETMDESSKQQMIASMIVISPNLKPEDILDIQTTMYMIQAQRAKLLEQQLEDQMAVINARNEAMKKLNEILSQLNRFKEINNNNQTQTQQSTEPNQTQFQRSTGPNNEINIENLSNFEQLRRDYEILIGSKLDNIPTLRELEEAINKIKELIDLESNSQQIDMVRLQTLTNKRNEAFDAVENFIKKMSETRSSIISNMR